MMRGMYAAISGLSVNQSMLDVTANNLANVNTIGYKAQRTTFADALTQVERGASAASAVKGGSNPVQIGLGVQLDSIDNMMSAGSFQVTNNSLDIAIQGSGFLRVGQGSPPAAPPYTSNIPTSLLYTQAGNLTTNQQGFLETQSGNYVIGREAISSGATPPTYTPGTNDTYINVPPGSTNVSISPDGGVTYIDSNPSSATYQQQVTAGYISLANFPNSAGLQRVGESLWQPTANSGSEVVGTPNTTGFGSTIGGTLEMSNVDLATEFTTMIGAERGFQANSRVITTADQMLQDVVNMKQ